MSLWEIRLLYYRRAHHRKGLPGSCLAIGKNAGIVALEGTFYYVRTKIVENLEKDNWLRVPIIR